MNQKHKRMMFNSLGSLVNYNLLTNFGESKLNFNRSIDELTEEAKAAKLHTESCCGCKQFDNIDCFFNCKKLKKEIGE